MAPARALKTQEEIDSIPLDQEILIELPGGVSSDDTAPPAEAKQPKAKPADDGARQLQEQLEAAQAAAQANADRAAKAEREAIEARRQAQEALTRTQALEGDLITGGLAAAQAEQAAAEQELERAGEAGDYKAMAKAQSRVARASAQIVNLESGAAEIAERKPVKEPVQEQARQQPTDINVAIDSAPNLMPAERAWLKAHPDAFMPGPRNNELSVGYERAIKQGLTRGTQQYFDYLNEFMGYAKPEEQERDVSLQAPPSRNDRGNDGRPTGNKVTLTPEERAIAQSMGLSETAYALNKVKFENARRADPDKYR